MWFVGGKWYNEVLMFVEARGGTTQFNLATPAGYFTPANQAVQLVTTVTAPAINIQVNDNSFIVGNNLLSNGNLSIGDRKSVAQGKSVTLSGRRIIKKKRLRHDRPPTL